MNRILTYMAMLILFVCSLVLGQEAGKTKDYSNSPRSEVPVEYTWNLEEIYENDEVWREDFNELKALLPKLKEKAGIWTESAANAYDFFSYMDKLEQKFILISRYAALKRTGEISNSKYTSMSGEVNALGVEFNLIYSGLREQILVRFSGKLLKSQKINVPKNSITKSSSAIARYNSRMQMMKSSKTT